MEIAESLAPFYRTLGLRPAVEAADGRLVALAACQERFSNPGEIMHGGYYCLVGAAAADLLVARDVGDGARFAPLDYKVNLFRPMRMGGDATATARLVHRGRRSLVAVSELSDDQGRLACLMTTTFAAVGASDPAIDVGARGAPPIAGAVLPGRGPSTSRFFQTLAIEVVETRRGYARVEAPYAPEFALAGGALHPAFLVGVADSAAGPCSGTVLAEGDSVSTIEYKVSFVRPVREGGVVAHGHVLSTRGDTLLVQVDVDDTAGRLCARMLTTLTALPKPA